MLDLFVALWLDFYEVLLGQIFPLDLLVVAWFDYDLFLDRLESKVVWVLLGSVEIWCQSKVKFPC